MRDFADFSFHSYFSVMDGLLESKGEKPIELKYVFCHLDSQIISFCELSHFVLTIANVVASSWQGALNDMGN